MLVCDVAAGLPDSAVALEAAAKAELPDAVAALQPAGVLNVGQNVPAATTLTISCNPQHHSNCSAPAISASGCAATVAAGASPDGGKPHNQPHHIPESVTAAATHFPQARQCTLPSSLGQSSHPERG